TQAVRVPPDAATGPVHECGAPAAAVGAHVRPARARTAAGARAPAGAEPGMVGPLVRSRDPRGLSVHRLSMDRLMLDGGGWDRARTNEAMRRHVNAGMARIFTLSDSAMECRSEGSLVYDERGQPYLDCGGYCVFLLGHRHPRVVAAVAATLDRHPL